MTGSADKAQILMRQAAQSIGAEDWVGAERALTACVALLPDEPSAAYNLALVEKRLEKAAVAEKRLASLLETSPTHENARFEYAASLMNRGAESEALAQFEIYLRSRPTDCDARLNAARLCLRLGHADAAVGHLEAASHERPDDPAIRLAQAEALRELGIINEADEIFRGLYSTVPSLRPAILKAMSQGRSGRIPLDRRALESGR